MPYLGNPPAERFTSLSKQTITGDGGTAYTLDFPVGSDQDVEVFVNNVRQEPSVAYTVSGTSLTMTGAVQSSDDFYVVFQGKAVASVTHPAANALQATSGTFTGDLTVDTNTLFVDASANNVGIGTTSPQDTLHVGGTGDTGIKIGTQGSTGRARIFVDSSNDYALAIDTQNVSDALIIERVTGNLLVGTTSAPTGSTGGSGFIAESVGRKTLKIASTTTGGAGIAEFINPNGIVGSISTSGSSTSFNTSSDYRLKENVTPLDNASDRLKQIPVHRFNFIADPDTTVDGFLAHEVQAIVPEAISGEKDAVDDEGNPDYQGIDQSKLVPLLTAALQEALTKIEDLEVRLSTLETN